MQVPIEPVSDDNQRPRVYRLDGVDSNPVGVDTREAFDQAVAELVAGGMDPERAEVRAYELREERYGIGPAHGFYGQPVSHGFRRNLDILVAPLTEDHVDAISERMTIHPLSRLDQIVYVLFYSEALSVGAVQPEQIALDAEGGLVIPARGSFYGTAESNAFELIRALLCAHGRVTGLRADGSYVLEPILPEDLPDDLISRFSSVRRPGGMSVFEEILRTTGLWEVWKGGILVDAFGVPEDKVTNFFRALVDGERLPL